LLATVTLVAPAAAWGHVSVSGPGYAGKSAILTFGVGHGCEGFDTNTIDVSIPPEITSLRGVTSPAFGDPTMVKDDAEIITNVVWTKTDSRDADDMYYPLAIRTTLPNTPFVTLYFPAHQVCMGEGGEELVTDWAALPGAEPLEDGSEPPPAPALTIMPPRTPGWNKYVVPVEITSLSIFNDALIVWNGDAAYSANAETAALIEAEEGVTTLTSIAADDTIWVKY
jgi:uncharacterized protein YcnI